MATLNYWVAESDQGQSYNLRAKTKKALVKMLDGWGCNPDGSSKRGSKYDYPHENSFGPPHKVEVYYRDAFHLLTQCLSEGSVYEGDL